MTDTTTATTVADARAALHALTNLVVTADTADASRDYVVVAMAGGGAATRRHSVKAHGYQPVAMCYTVDRGASSRGTVWAMVPGGDNLPNVVADVADKARTRRNGRDRLVAGSVFWTHAYVVDAGSVSAARDALATLYAAWVDGVDPTADDAPVVADDAPVVKPRARRGRKPRATA